MNHERAIRKQRQRRRQRVLKHIRGTSDCPRLSVFRSHKHIYAQLVDDLAGKTLAAASTRDREVAGDIKYGGNTAAATKVGQVIALRAQAAGIHKIAFDRGHFQYHGRVAALAEAAREAGLKF